MHRKAHLISHYVPVATSQQRAAAARQRHQQEATEFHALGLLSSPRTVMIVIQELSRRGGTSSPALD